MRWLVQNFLKGCLVLVPTVCALYAVYFLFLQIDGLLALPVPGLGFVVTIAFVTALGVFTSNVIGGRIFHAFERLLVRVPIVKFFYRALRDFAEAFVGDRRSFDRPVRVRLTNDVDGPSGLGFITTEDLGRFGLSGCVAVYMPQALNFAGNLLVFPVERVEALDVDPTEFMAFMVSGGVVTNRPSMLPPPG